MLLYLTTTTDSLDDLNNNKWLQRKNKSTTNNTIIPFHFTATASIIILFAISSMALAPERKNMKEAVKSSETTKAVKL